MIKTTQYILLCLLMMAPSFYASPQTCFHCSKPIDDQYIVYNGEKYHKHCFNAIRPRCEVCGMAIDQQYVVHEGKNYHEKCYKNVIAKKCSICSEPMMGKYRVDWWGSEYHIEHETQLPQCDYCGRLISEQSTNGGREYDDGRKSCNLCYASVVSNYEDVKRIVESVKSILESRGIVVDMSIVPVVLVDKAKLMKLSEKDASPKEMGLAHHEFTERNGRKIKSQSTIYILYGLPERTFEGVLAHEMMHVWTYNNMNSQPEPEIAEGISNYAAYIVYSVSGDKMAQFLSENLYKDPDPNYGEGFRMIDAVVKKDGLPAVLNKLRNGRKIF